MKKIVLIMTIFLWLASEAHAQSAYVGTYVNPETQPQYREDQYEIMAGHKLQRGLENFFLGWLEVPHGIKKTFYERRQEYLNPGLESVFIGTFRGLGNTAKRMAVGFYEGFTFVYPQDPILEEMDEWPY